MTDVQEIILAVSGVAFAAVNGWFVFVLQGLKNDVRELRESNVVTATKLALHEKEMAKTAISREEFREGMQNQTLVLQRLVDSIMRK